MYIGCPTCGEIFPDLISLSIHMKKGCRGSTAGSRGGGGGGAVSVGHTGTGGGGSSSRGGGGGGGGRIAAIVPTLRTKSGAEGGPAIEPDYLSVDQLSAGAKPPCVL